MDYPAINFLSQNTSRKVRKLLGRAYLREYRVADAIDAYLALLRDYPEDADALIVLGNLYQISGNAAAGERLYQRALKINPVHPLAKGPVRARAYAAGWNETTALAPATLSRLEERLICMDSPEGRQAVCEAADVLDRLASADRASRPLGKMPEVLQRLMPALIEQNVRQARSDGLVDLAEALQSLQINLTLQADADWLADAMADGDAGEAPLNSLDVEKSSRL